MGCHCPFARKTPRVTMAWMCGSGVRAVDIRDPFRPKEVGYFIPQVTEATEPTCVEIDGVEECKVAIQTNNVEIDDRGYIYLLDRRGTGLHIVALTGPAHDIVGLP